MAVYVALLRAVNVGGRGAVAMADLRRMLSELGFERVQTLLNSGNLVFSGDTNSGEIEALLEREAARRLGVSTDFLVRDAQEWASMVAANPFPDEAEADPGHLLVVCLKNTPEPSQVQALQSAVQGPELVRAQGRALYITYPDGIGRSKLTIPVIEKKLGARGTGRNWNTVLKLDGLARAILEGP
ncbi:MAG TPA: DUF1697 domain-containing protein [Chloroflexota bacterium]